MEAFNFSKTILAALLILRVVTHGAADSFAAGVAVGINYGRVADNLPPPSKAVELMKTINAGYVKIYDADSQVLAALANSSLPVVITIPNDQISGIGSSSSSADQWVASNVAPYFPATNISMIMVGNEFLSDYGSQSAWPQLVPAMENIHASLVKNGVDSAIKVTTSVSMDALASSYPPSNGSFRADIASSVLQPMLSFLANTDSYFFLDVYPFFAWSSNPVNISLDYVLFGITNTASAIRDGSLEYTNMLDAQVDATVAAMAELGYGNVKIAISETGWPNKGDANQPGVNVANAALYNQRLVAKLLSNAGTPRRPNVHVPAFLFALFNEDDKAGATTERNWGVFYADGTPIYEIDLSKGSNDSNNGVDVVKATTGAGAAAASPINIFALFCVFFAYMNIVFPTIDYFNGG